LIADSAIKNCTTTDDGGSIYSSGGVLTINFYTPCNYEHAVY
jgi:hypothetical protein